MPQVNQQTKTWHFHMKKFVSTKPARPRRDQCCLLVGSVLGLFALGPPNIDTPSAILHAAEIPYVMPPISIKFP